MNNISLALNTYINKKDKEILFILVITTLIILLLRNFGLYPSVVDEYVYSSNSRLLPLSNDGVPDYFYRFIYSLVGVCHKGWLDCSRLLNGIFFIMAAPFIYSISKRYTTNLMSIWIVLISLWAPINIYTAFFMPESMYFLLFWVFVWITSQNDSLQNNKKIIISGMTLGFLALIKPHAILIIPIIFFIGFISLKYEKFSFNLRFFKLILIFLISFFSVKFVIGFLFSGYDGLSLFGKNYSALANNMIINSNNLEKLLGFLGNQFLGHITTLTLIYSVPIAFISYSLINLLSKRSHKSVKNHLYFFTFSTAVTFGLMTIAVLFTSAAAMVNPSEAIRLHLRYYDFSFTLLILLLTIMPNNNKEYEDIKTRLISLIPVIILIIFGAIFTFKHFSPNYVDGPEIRGYFGSVWTFYLLYTLSIIALIIWIISPVFSKKFYLFIFIPFYVVMAGYYANKDLRSRLYLTPYDRAAIFSSMYLSNEESSKLTIIGAPEALGPLILSKIYFENTNVSVKTLPESSKINISDIEPGKNWILTVGSYDLVANKSFEFLGNGFTLHKVQTPELIDFKKIANSGAVSSYIGLGQPESWGSWSFGREVIINFKYDLPNSFKLTITASPYGSNINKDVIIHVGDKYGKVVFKGDKDSQAINFDNVAIKTKTISIEIPDPEKLGPNQFGIGLGLIEMKIDPIFSGR